MDLSSIGIDTTALGSGGLILVGGFATLWGIKRVIGLFKSSGSSGLSPMSKSDQSRGDYYFREKHYGAGGLDPSTYRGRVR